MGPTEALARFAGEVDSRWQSATIVPAARRAILDCVGVALAGTLEPAARVITAQALGNPFAMAGPGANYKAWPCCASTFGGVDAALQVAAGLSDQAIDRVTVDVPHTAPLMLIHHRPTTPLAAKFSLEYCVAAALLDGRVTLGHFSEEAVSRPDLQSLLRRVEYRVPEEWQKDAGAWKQGHGRVEVRLSDGSVRRGASQGRPGADSIL